MNLIKSCRTLILASVAASITLVPSVQAIAAEYPEKPITAIVPFGAGGGTDTYARTLGSVAYDILKQPLVVVNRPGGGVVTSELSLLRMHVMMAIPL